MEFEYGWATDIGRKRTQNQDSLGTHPELGLFLVADGMGGHRGGETASAIVSEILPEVIRGLQSRTPDWDPPSAISEAIQAANSVIFQKAIQQPQLRGMGTTTTALLFKGEKLVIGHVGDSRCYFLRPHLLWQATRDHSLVQEKLKAGLIQRSELKTDRMKNVITRSVGFEIDVNSEVYELELQPLDTFLLCSDGLTSLVEDAQILSIVQEELFEKGSAQSAAEALIKAANANGGDDNITAIVVQPSQRGSA